MRWTAAILVVVLCAACKPTGQRTAGVPNEPTRFPFQETRWSEARLNAVDIIRLDKAVDRWRENEQRYRTIEKGAGVPAPVIFTLHGRESTWSFRHHLHEGSPLTGRTKYVPKGRPLTGNPPFTFEESAIDALTYDRMGQKNWRSLGDSLQAIEAYNGLGYQKYHPETPSPYLWAGTSLYTSGKYVADGKWSATARDKQLGCAAILKRMHDRGIKLPFGTAGGKPLSQWIRWRARERIWSVYPAIAATAGGQQGQYVTTVEIRGTMRFFDFADL
jgi:lysozyme family protein